MQTHSRRRVLAVGAVVIAVAAVVMARVTGVLGGDDEVVRAARDGLTATVPGVTVGELSGYDIEGSCAVVQFETSRGVDKVAVVRDVHGTWASSRVATDADYFDLDSGWATVGCTP